MENGNIIGAFEAKTHFSQLLQRLEQGESFIITRHGRKVGKLTALDDDEKASEPEEKSQLYKALEARHKKIRRAQKKKGNRGMTIPDPGKGAFLEAHKKSPKKKNLSAQVEKLRRDMQEYRKKNGIPPVTIEEIIAWKNEGRM